MQYQQAPAEGRPHLGRAQMSRLDTAAVYKRLVRLVRRLCIPIYKLLCYEVHW